MLLRVVLFVSEGKARDAIQFYLQEMYPLIGIVGMFDSCDGGTEILKRFKPDIVIFEQRKMQDASGELYYALNFHQSVHSEMADERDIFAFNGNYNIPNVLHDPINNANFKMVMDANIIRYYEKNPAGGAAYFLLANLPCPAEMRTMNIFIIDKGLRDIILGDISVLHCNKQKTDIYLIKDNKMLTTSQALGRLKKHLPPEMFVAIGRSTKVNGQEILEYKFNKIWYITMKNDSKAWKVNDKFVDAFNLWIEEHRPDLLED